MKKLVSSFVILFSLLVFISNSMAQDDPFEVKKTENQLVIVSGIESGSYYQMVNDMAKNLKTPIKVLTSGGSVNNYNQLINNASVDLVFMQYDVLQAAKMHDYKTKQHISENVEIVLPLATEEIHLVTRTNSDIKSIADLSGKKVGVGIPSKEGTNVTAGLIKSVTASKWEDVEISFDSAFAALINNEIDAFFFVGYAPVKKFEDLLPTFNQIIRLVPITDERLSQFHVKTKIKADSYPWLHYDVETFGVRSVLVTNKQFESPNDAELYKEFLTEVKTNIGELQKNGHSKWNEVNFSFKGINWPIHAVSKKVFNIK